MSPISHKSELITLDKHVMHPLPKVGASEYPFLTADLAVDTTMLENELNSKQKIAAQLDAMLPQIREPLAAQGGYHDIDFEQFMLKLERMMRDSERQWEEVETLIELYKARLKALMEVNIQSNEAAEFEADKRAFELADANLSDAQSKIDEVILLLTNLQANEAPTDDELLFASNAAKEAFAQVNTAVAGLDAKYIGFVATSVPELDDNIKNSGIKLSILEECLYRIQTIMQNDKMATMQHRSDHFAAVKEVLLENIRIMADKQRDIDETAKFWMEFWKWTGVVLAGIVAYATGGLGGFLLGLATAALVVADLSTDGKATAAIFKPLTDEMGPAFEKMITGLMDYLVKEKEYDETEAIGITMAIFFGATLLPSLAAGAGGKAMEKAGQTALGQSIAKSVQEVMTDIAESFVGQTAGAVKKGLEELFDAVITNTGIKAIEKAYQRFLEEALGIVGTEAYINALMQLQTVTSLVGTGLEGFFSIKGAIAQKEGQEVAAEIKLEGAKDEIVSSGMKALADSHGKALNTIHESYKILARLQASKQETMSTVYRSLRA